MKRAFRGQLCGGLENGLRASLLAGPVARVSSSLVVLLFTLLFMSASSIAVAAEIVDVRVGQHPTFTRVVFELDSAAGYQLSKAAPGTAGDELVVILQATSIPRRVQAPRKSLLGLVRVAPDGRTAVVRIELKKSGLVVKERIMSSPYRVVLDVIDPKAEAAARATTAKPAPKPKPKPKPAPKPVPTPTPVQPPAPKAAAPAPKPVIPAPAPTKVPEEDDLLGATGGDPAPAPIPQRMGQAAPKAPARRAETPEPSEGGIATMGQSERTAPPKKPSSPPKAKMADSEDGWGFGSVIMIGGGALLAVFALLFFMRKRARTNRESDDEIAGEPADEGEDVNPFAAMRDESAPAEPAQTDAAGPNLTLDSLVDEMPSTPPGQDEGSDVAAEPDLGQTTVTTRDAEGGEEPFSLSGEDDDGSAVDAGVPPAMDTRGAAEIDGDDEEIGEEEMSRLIQQFEQRIAALESRVDEQSEARERLERQVAAQTEELRVQRAAIARTQRAVRNLTRGDEDGPTEPALREPDGQ